MRFIGRRENAHVLVRMTLKSMTVNGGAEAKIAETARWMQRWDADVPRDFAFQRLMAVAFPLTMDPLPDLKI
jgi:hypothetical protein